MSKTYTAVTRFHFYEPAKKGMRLVTYNIGDSVSARIVKLYGLVDKNYVGLV